MIGGYANVVLASLQSGYGELPAVSDDPVGSDMYRSRRVKPSMPLKLITPRRVDSAGVFPGGSSTSRTVEKDVHPLAKTRNMIATK